MHGRRGEEPIRGASLQWRTNTMGLAVSTRLAWEAGGGIYSGDARGRRCAAVWTGKGAGVSLSALAFGSPGLWRRDSALCLRGRIADADVAGSIGTATPFGFGGAVGVAEIASPPPPATSALVPLLLLLLPDGSIQIQMVGLGRGFGWSRRTAK